MDFSVWLEVPHGRLVLNLNRNLYINLRVQGMKIKKKIESKSWPRAAALITP
jgi:hypothetical protein